MDTLTLYLKYLSASVRSQMQYRVSFILLSVGNFLASAIDFAGIAVLFSRFGALKNWTLGEVALFYGLSQLSFAFAECWGRGFDIFSRTVREGQFDRVLLRPRGAAMQVLASEFQIMRVGRFLQGAAAFALGAATTDVVWSAPNVLMLLGGLLGGILVFSAVMVVQATACFWTVDSLEAFNIFSFGGLEAMHYPLDIYGDWFRRALTYVIPLAAGGWLPIGAVLGRVQPYASGFCAPFMGAAFMFAAYAFWRFGLKRYQSTGS